MGWSVPTDRRSRHLGRARRGPAARRVDSARDGCRRHHGGDMGVRGADAHRPRGWRRRRDAGGRILVAGGVVAGTALGSAEVHDPASAAWSPTATMATPRSAASATLLGDGCVLVAGGTAGGTPMSSAELYDPAPATWTSTGRMSSPRTGHTATRLSDGRVLVDGGFDGEGFLASAESYDPATGAWTVTGPTAMPHFGHTATALRDGRVLVAGGDIPDQGATTPDPIFGGPLASAQVTGPVAERYDPASGAWTQVASLRPALSLQCAALLGDGGALVVGSGQSDGRTATLAEVFRG